MKEITTFFDCAFSAEVKHQCLPNAIKVAEKKLEEISKQIDTLRRAESHLKERISSWKEILSKGADQNE
ncbi:hypothetical protein [Paenibacillus solani]|uniref:hypothetical protein n=1 Tax=Paenibacillus solani TaxID=1705565 RepID=UPI003D285BC1